MKKSLAIFLFMMTLLGFSGLSIALEDTTGGDQYKKDMGCSVARQIALGSLNAGQLNTEQSLSLNYLRSNYFQEYQSCSGAEEGTRRPAAVQSSGVPYEGTVKYIPGSNIIGLDSGQKITLLGIKILEEKKKDAADYLKQKLQGHTVHVVYDRERTDRYGKLQGYVFLEKVFVNRALIDEGFAQANIVPPNEMYRTQLTRDKNAPEVSEETYEEVYMKNIQKKQAMMIYLTWGGVAVTLVGSIFLRSWLKR